jgi:quercetin dioxygenase-like cupin family protein
MARSGDVIENPVTGERIEFLRTAAETGGALLRVVLSVKPHGFLAAEHEHPRQEERFEVLSGTMRVRLRGVERVLGAGESVAVPPGTPHAWFNDGSGELRALVEFRPALKTELFCETFFGLARNGKTGKNGLPNLLQLAVLARAFRDEGRLTRPPWAVQRVVFALLAPPARVLGYRAHYARYSARGERCL